jgi:hypothetical protein
MGPSAPPTSPLWGADINSQLAQARELEAKLAEEYRTVRLLRASITGEASPRRLVSASTLTSTSTTRTCPHELAKSSLLPRHCCGPCPLLQRPRRETCTVKRRHSSSKRPYKRLRARRPTSASRGERGTTGARKSPRRQFTRAARQGSPPTRARRRSGSGSLTHAVRLRTTTLAMSSMPGGRAMREHGRRQATNHGGVGATTAVRTAHQRRNPQGLACSAGRSARRASCSASVSPRPSTSTRGDGPPCMVQRLPPGMPAGRCHHRRGDHPQPAATPR